MSLDTAFRGHDGHLPGVLAEHLYDRLRVQCVDLGHAEGVGDDRIDVGGADAGVLQCHRHRPRGLRGVRRRFAPVVGVVGGAVADDLAVDLRGFALLGALQTLDQQDRSALAGDIPVGARASKGRWAGRVLRGAEKAGAQLAGEGVRADRCLHAAAEGGLDAAADRAPRVGQRLQAAGALGEHHAGGALHPVLDRDLPRGGGVEPGDRLVGAVTNTGPFSHSAWISRCPNSLPPEELAVITLIE